METLNSRNPKPRMKRPSIASSVRLMTQAGGRTAPWMIRLKIPVTILAALGLLAAGCTSVQSRYEAVSSQPEYEDIVGSEYTFRAEMHLSGVNAPPGYEPTVDYYVVKPAAPSWSGPELITRETLPVGTIARVEAVERCTNCPFENRLRARITLAAYPRLDRPVYLPLQYLNDDMATRLSPGTINTLARR